MRNLILVLLLNLSNYVINANVIGIDLGSDNFKVAVVQPGDPLEIVSNFQSKRKTPTCVTFYRGERLFGADAAALMARKPELTFSRLTRMIGRTPEHPHIDLELKNQYFPYEIYTNETWGGTCIKQEETHYTPEELIAMLLQHAKDMTQNYGGKIIKDCVITVPSSFTQRAREAIYSAADIAELKVLSLIEENTAAALHFGMDRVFETKHNVLFYNMGSSSVQVSIVSYSSYQVKESGKNKTIGQFEVVGKGWDSSLGGFTFDVRLADLLATRFNEVWNKKASGKGKDLKDFLRPMTRLRVEAVKIKEVLSANTEFPVKAEQLHADTDLNTKVTRLEFEKACEDLYPRLTTPISLALEMANLSLDNIHAVELLGGGVRMPKVKKVLEEYFRVADLDLGQHLNGDEAMALGSAFRAANLSTAFRVRKVGISDTSSFGVSVRLQTLPQEAGFFDSMLGLLGRKDKGTDKEEVWEKFTSLYPRKSSVPSKSKTVAFQYSDDILCKLEYDDDVKLPEGTEKILAVYNITGISEFAKESANKGLGQPKVHLSFNLDTSGIVTLTRAEATVDLPQEPEDEKVDSEEALKSATEEEDKTNSTSTTSTESTTDDATNSTDTNSTTSNSTDSNSTSSTSSKPKKDPKKKEPKKVKKDNTLRRTLQIIVNHDAISPSTWSPAMIAAAKQRLRTLQAIDEARKAKEAAMNELEGYIYKVKNRINDDEKALSTVSTADQRQAVLDICTTTGDWLDEEGQGQEVGTFKNKLSSIRRLAEPIFLRYSEKTDRPAAVAKAKKVLLEVRNKVAEWDIKLPQVTSTEKSSLIDSIDKAERWIEEKVAAQSKLADTEEPVFYSEDVPLQLKALSGQFERLLRKPKPPPEKVTVINSNSTTTSNTTSTDPDSTSSTNSSSSDSTKLPEDNTTTTDSSSESNNTDNSNSEKDESKTDNEL